jgi:hypothetical protein
MVVLVQLLIDIAEILLKVALNTKKSSFVIPGRDFELTPLIH